MSLTLTPGAIVGNLREEDFRRYDMGRAYGLMLKAAERPVAAPVLSGRLVVSNSGWLLLTVPNALVRGLFDAMDEPGIELPLKDGRLTAHISVMRKEEVEKLGGPDKISERGHFFSYQLGPVKSVEPKGWPEMSRVWFVEVQSPALKALRKSYGLAPLPNGDHEFHITICVRRRHVLRANDVSKAAGAGGPEESEAEDSRHGGQDSRLFDAGSGASGPLPAFLAQLRDEAPVEPPGGLGTIAEGGLNSKRADFESEHGTGGPPRDDYANRNYFRRLFLSRVADEGNQDQSLGLPDRRGESSAVHAGGAADPGLSRLRADRNDDGGRDRLRAGAADSGRPSGADSRGLDRGGIAAEYDPKVRSRQRKLVERVINDIPGEDMVGAWWHRLDGKVRVSLGDWSETPSREVHEKLERILGDARVEVDAEIGAPAGPDWEKLAGPKTSRGRLMALIADPDYFKDRPGLPDTPKVVAEIRRAIRRLPPLMPGYGDVYYNPEERKVYVVCGDSDEREVIDSWRRRLTAIDGIDAYDGESEHVRPEVGTLRAAKPPWVKVAGLKAREPRQEAKVFTAAVDLDGTIYAYDTWKGEDHFGKLRPGVLKALREFQRRGWRIIIFTTRGNTAKVKQRLNADDVPFDYINENPDQPEGTSCKVIADIYIDDRAVDASMSWERVIEAVDRKFRKAAAAPWNWHGDKGHDPHYDKGAEVHDGTTHFHDDHGRRAGAGRDPSAEYTTGTGRDDAGIHLRHDRADGCFAAARTLGDLDQAGRRLTLNAKGAAAPPPALIDAIVAEELKRDAAVPLPPRKLMPPVPLARSPLFDPSPEVFNDATMNALVHEQMLPDGDPFPLPEVSDAEKAAALLANNAAMVTALLPSRIPAPRLAPARRRPNRRPAADLLTAQQEAANVDALIPMLRARRARPGLLLKQALDPIADFAPGLPRKDAYGDLSKLTPGQLLTYVLQYHRAHRAGPHHDLRFGSPEMGLHSWAVPRGLPPPGGKNLAIHQPVHRHRYRKFEGEIPRGQYGAGTVKKVDEGQVLITKAGPDHIHFTLAHKRHPERYTLLRPRSFGRSRDWLLVNTTPAEKVPFEKLHYRRVPSDRIEDAIRQMGAGSSVEAKVDGASQLVHLLKGHAEHFSYRTSKETNRPIFHTERVFGGRPEIKYPPHLEGSILKGELHAGPISSRPNDRRHAGVGPGTGAGDAGHRSGAFGPQDIATLLNSSVGRSLQLQREQGVKVRNMLYDVGRYGRRPIGPDVPRAERREMLGEFMKHLPADTFHLSEPVHTPAEGIEMLRQIRSGEHPLTQEGVVIHPAQGMPLKGKFTDEHLVHVTGTFPGEGKRSRTVGGFTYGHEPGRTVGRVGSGFSDKFLDEVARDPAAFTGRLARVKAQEKLPSGALRAPVFLGLHEDYNAAPVKAAGTAASRARVLSTIRPGAQPSWVQHVMAHYDSTKPPPGIFTRGADEIVAAGRDPHVAPLGLGSWQKMVIFHRNRGGNRLGEERRDVLQTAIRRLSDEIREGREKAGGLLPSVQLQPQQRRVAERVNAYDPRVLVYHGLGSGKSLASIAAAERSGRPYVAAVPAALRPNYHKELAKFTDLHTPSSVLSYTQVGQGKQPLVNPDTLILDEFQRLRNPDSAATRGVMDLAARARRVLMLSGTPIVNNPSDLAVPLSILTGTPVTTREFNKRFVGKQEVSPGFLGRLRGIRPATVPTIAHEQELEDLLRGHVDYQPSRMPEGVRTNEERVVVDMSPPQKDFYRLMWNQLPWTTRWKMRHDYPMTAEELKNLQAFMTGPRQAALSLYPFRADGDALRAFHDSTKLKRAFDDVRTALGKDPRAKVIAYSNFIDAGLTPYAAALKAHGVPYSILHGKLNDAERKAQLDAYNQGKSRVLLIGPSAAEGISAQGTQLIQLLDPHWNEARMGQARGRGLRFDSHEGLPEELRNVAIRRYVARMPDPGFFGRLFGGGPRPTADEFLEAQARRKEDLNEQFRAVLRRVGSEPPTRPWWRVFS